ncbi:MAG TPA: carboxypeptidase regulatory-like domain-containing protein [Vicinamibacterales bacterium]|nr:carboxypeptidase regulatory-like domain-containing protein [Vicinamibacterales bacterium]
MLTLAVPAFAQQTGTISGKVTDSSGGVLPGVTVEARSPVLPGPRDAVTQSDGSYQMPALPPGTYTVTYTLQGMQTVTKKVAVQLAEVTNADATLGVGGVTESVTVTAEASFIDRTSAAVKDSISDQQINALPVGTQYRDLVNLIPGVQYSQDQVRGQSLGASGQNNVYNFDGVNVTLPLFGTLSAEPTSQDIAQVTTVKGGARAVDFNRAGGFEIDSVSKSGTNTFHGEASYRFQNHSMAAALDNGSASRFDENSAWTDLNIGGPILPDKVFFYGSYYRPTVNRRNAATAYGPVPSYDSVRNEGFGKVTITPTHSSLFNVSYRDSHRLDKGAQFGSATAGTAGTGNEAWQRIATADGSWILNGNNVVTFKYTHFANPTRGRPDNVADTTVSTAPGTHLDTNNLDRLGELLVPKPIAGDPAASAFVQPLINQYGFIRNGVPTGGGIVGFGTEFDEDNFYRDSGQIAYDSTFSGMNMRHQLHFGYQQYEDSEDLTRSSNGWGLITVPAGTVSYQGTPIFYQATFQSQGIGSLPKIHSEYRSKDFEANDTITWKNWTYNVGLLASNDTLYGQGLQNDPSTLSGYVKATATTSEGRRYKMYNIPFSKMIQPRLSATWAYNGKDTIWASYARYNPAASSLPRAASWDRNLAATQNADFDADGNLFAVETVASSSGKLFVQDLTPTRFDEWIVGTAKQFTTAWSARAYFRYKRGSHYWEDTNNTARVAFDPPDVLPGTDVHIPKTPYIPDLNDKLAQIGSGSSYVIAELDGAFTDYRGLTLESEYQKGPLWANISYTYSRYYGNFDQDASAGTAGANDSNIFIGSSNIGDGAGRQLWNNKLGRLRGDKPNVFKMFGTYALSWNASVGLFVTAQSGQPWETHSYVPYKALTGSTSNAARYAEPAGSHRSPAQSDVDVNYTQRIPVLSRYNGAIAVYLFNVLNKQTGYSIDPNFNSATYKEPTAFLNPRRLELTLRFDF